MALPKHTFTDTDCINLHCYLADSTVTLQEKKKELRDMHPFNMAIFCDCLNGMVTCGAVMWLRTYVYDKK